MRKLNKSKNEKRHVLMNDLNIFLLNPPYEKDQKSTNVEQLILMNDQYFLVDAVLLKGYIF